MQTRHRGPPVALRGWAGHRPRPDPASNEGVPPHHGELIRDVRGPGNFEPSAREKMDGPQLETHPSMTIPQAGSFPYRLDEDSLMKYCGESRVKPDRDGPITNG